MDQDKVQALFRKFAAPLARYAATSPERKKLAEMLARNLWTTILPVRRTASCRAW